MIYNFTQKLTLENILWIMHVGCAPDCTPDCAPDCTPDCAPDCAFVFTFNDFSILEMYPSRVCQPMMRVF